MNWNVVTYLKGGLWVWPSLLMLQPILLFFFLPNLRVSFPFRKWTMMMMMICITNIYTIFFTVTLHDIVHTDKSLTLVFEYLDRDLKQYMDECGAQLSMNNVKVSKCYRLQKVL